MKKMLKRILPFFLVFVMLATTELTCISTARADEDDFESWESWDDWNDDTSNPGSIPGTYDPDPDDNPSGGDNPDYPDYPDDPDPDPDPEPHDDNYYLEANTYSLSFGTISQGSGDTDYQSFWLHNYGNNPINLCFYKADAERAFRVDNPPSMYLGPEESLQIFVCMRKDLNPGSYYATLLFGSCDDPDFSRGVEISLSGTIAAKEPYITYIGVVPGSVELARGSSLTFKADVRGENNPNLGVTWTVAGQSNSGTDIDNHGQLHIAAGEISDSLKVTATSVQDSNAQACAYVTLTGGQYSVVTSSNPTEGGTTGGGGTVAAGSSLSLLAAPNNGYSFVNWTVNGQVVSDKAKFELKNIKNDTKAVANFRKSSCYVKLKKNHENGGTITDSTSVNYGGSLTIKATPKSGFSFDAWYENGKVLSKEATVNLSNITSDREIHANFVQNVFSVSLQSNPSNTGMVSGGGNYSKGTNVAIKAKPVEGYEFLNWTYNNNVLSEDPNLTIKNIQEDMVVIANFGKKNVPTFTISAQVANQGGTISPAGVTTVTKGNSLVYTMAPAAGYVVSAVAVDGKQVGAVSSYSFTNVNANHNIAVAFAPKKTAPEQKPAPAPTQAPSSTVVTPPSAQEAPTLAPVNTEEISEIVIDDEGTTIDNIPVSQGDEYNTPDLDSLTGVLQMYNLSIEQAEVLMRNNKDDILLKAAAENQFLRVTVHNEFAKKTQETEETGYYNLASIPNMDEVVYSLLSEEEKMQVFQGNQVGINLSLFANDDLKTSDDQQIIKSALKQKVKIGKFFEILLLKNYQGSSQVITELDVPMEIVLQVPDDLYDKDREFYIIRAHQEKDGNLSINYLKDEDDNPSTITFHSDKFSSYAIGYSGGDTKTKFDTTTILVIIIILLAIAILVTILVGLVLAGKHRRRRRRRA